MKDMEMSTQPYTEGGQGPKPSSNSTSVASLLVADCGTVFTKVSLFGKVEGQYRLMARGESPTTIAPPYEDITKGIIQTINIIEFITGRLFVSEGRIISPEQSNGDGVDVFISTISAGGPVRLVVLGAVDAAMEQLAAQAASGLYAEIYSLPSPSQVATSAPVPISVGAGPSGAEDPWTPERVAFEWERQIERIRELQPHGALIVGMANGLAGPTPLQEACQLVINATAELNKQNSASTTAGTAPAGAASRQVAVLYAGAPQYVEAVQRMLQETSAVTRVDPLVSPQHIGSTSIAIGGLYERDVIQHIPGYSRLHSWSGSAPVPTATSLSSLVRFLAQHYTMNVTAVDVGGANTTLMMAGEGGEFIPTVNCGVGVGPSLGTVLQQVGVQRVARWLPFDITEDELRQYVLNHMLHPHVVPTNQRDLQITHAFAREAIILTAENARGNSQQ